MKGFAVHRKLRCVSLYYLFSSVEAIYLASMRGGPRQPVAVFIIVFVLNVMIGLSSAQNLLPSMSSGTWLLYGKGYDIDTGMEFCKVLTCNIVKL